MKQSFEWWKTEQAFITGINKCNPGEAFNNDSLCFARYIDMQAIAAERDGYPLIKADLLNHRDCILQMLGIRYADFEANRRK